jgi:hypothetical protein
MIGESLCYPFIPLSNFALVSFAPQAPNVAILRLSQIGYQACMKHMHLLRIVHIWSYASIWRTIGHIQGRHNNERTIVGVRDTPQEPQLHADLPESCCTHLSMKLNLQLE